MFLAPTDFLHFFHRRLFQRVQWVHFMVGNTSNTTLPMFSAGLPLEHISVFCAHQPCSMRTKWGIKNHLAIAGRAAVRLLYGRQRLGRPSVCCDPSEAGTVPLFALTEWNAPYSWLTVIINRHLQEWQRPTKINNLAVLTKNVNISR